MQTRLENFTDRLVYLIDIKGFKNPHQFGKYLGYEKTESIGRLVRNAANKPGYDVLEAIANKFGNVIAWLITGKGELPVKESLGDNVPQELQGQNAGLSAGFSEKRSEGEEHAVSVMAVPFTPEGEGIPYYEIDVAAGPVEIFSDSPEYPALKLVVPGFEDCNFSLNLWGDSMIPRYKPGCIILCRRITDKFTAIIYGEPYLIITKELRTVKYIKKSNKPGYWLLVSENTFYDPFEVEIESVLHVFLVKGSIERSSI